MKCVLSECEFYKEGQCHALKELYGEINPVDVRSKCYGKEAEAEYHNIVDEANEKLDKFMDKFHSIKIAR